MKNNIKLLVLMAAFALTVLVLPTSSTTVDASSKCFNSGKLSYKVTGSNTCSVTGLTSKASNSKSCTIPSTVKNNGKTYKVTSVASKAFCNNDSLTSVTCPSSVKTIGTKAFYDCDSLKSVKIGNNCNTVGTNCFSGCGSLNKINCSSVITNCGSNCFGNATCRISK